ncbi:O-antigen ligase family protein [Colwellia sp. MB3u-8]|uniref:O-antigen ligase family protein n=2 Tax=unclassified Colwellia TaxID=196834 RepID=UPI0015F36644|nr:O-antigen ligase family protein [Colwellia sp. MB3u-8]MBA6291508.1 O-antigen ligase family protein [Colwellia sp. MB3u-8]
MKFNQQQLFNVFVLYSWSLLYLSNIPGINENIVYIITVFPALIVYSLISYSGFKNSDKSFKVNKGIFILILFFILGSFLSVIRGDLKNIFSSFLFCVCFISIIHLNLKLDLKFLNKIFYISVLLSIPLYHVGFSVYGYIPGQSSMHHLEALSGRVSMFTKVSQSIYLSLFVLLINLNFNKSKWKFIPIILSLYYIVFGVSRTAVLILLFSLIFFFMCRTINKKSSFFSLFLPVALIVLPILLLININFILNTLLGLDLDIINTYLFRGYDDTSMIMKDTARIYIWSEHLRIFQQFPLGIDQISVINVIDRNLLEGGWTESYITRLLVQYGISGFIIYIYILYFLKESLISNSYLVRIFPYLFIFIGLLYGSFYQPYNFIFIVFLCSVNMTDIKSGNINKF